VHANSHAVPGIDGGHGPSKFNNFLLGEVCLTRLEFGVAVDARIRFYLSLGLGLVRDIGEAQQQGASRALDSACATPRTVKNP
jgi:hypothetical protein